MIDPDELTKMTVRWRKTRAKYEDLHRRHEYLFAAWVNVCAENENLRAEIAQLQEDQ